MTYNVGYGIIDKLAGREILTPHLTKIIQQDKWPGHYLVELPEHGAGKDGLFHPSTHVKGNARWLYMNLHPETRDKVAKERLDYTSIMTMAAGTAMHAILQTHMVQGGLSSVDEIEATVFNEEHHYTGHLDAICHVKKPYVVDIKTTNPNNFARLSTPNGRLPENYLLQILCYMYDKQIEDGIVLFLEMARPFRMKEFHVKLDDANMTKLNELFEKWDYVWDCIQNNTPPRECCGLGSADYLKCNASDLCWGPVN